MLQRPDNFRLNIFAPSAQGLVFAGLGFRGSDKTTHYHDSSLYGNHGTLNGFASSDWIFDGELGRFVYNLDGNDNYIHLVGSSISLSTLSSFTAAVWLYQRTTPGEPNSYENAIFYKENEFALTLDCSGESNQREFWLRDASSWSKVGNVQSTGTLLAWQHLAVTFDGTSACGYVNGVLTLGPTGDAKQNTTGNLRIGYDYTTNDYTDGLVSDPCVWNRALSQAEIQALADPSNVMLSGLILPPRRVLWPVAVGGGSTLLVIPASECVVNSPTVDLVYHHVAVVPASEVVVNSPTVDLVQHYGPLTVEASECVVESAEPALVQHHALIVPASECVVESPEVALVQHHALTVDASECVVESPTIDLVYHHVLVVESSECVVTSPTVTLNEAAPTYTPMMFMVC